MKLSALSQLLSATASIILCPPSRKIRASHPTQSNYLPVSNGNFALDNVPRHFCAMTSPSHLHREGCELVNRMRR